MSYIVFIAGIVGIVVMSWGLVSSYLEFQALISLNLNGPRRVTAISNIIKDSVVIVIQGIIMVVGATGSVKDRLDVVAWTLVSALLLLGAIVDRVRRAHLHWMYDRNQQEAIKFHLHRRATDPPTDKRREYNDRG